MPDVTTQARPTGAQAAKGAPVLSVIVPSFNECPNVAPMVAKLDAALAGIAWEVIYVDDNSPDGPSREVRRETAAAADLIARLIQDQEGGV